MTSSQSIGGPLPTDNKKIPTKTGFRELKNEEFEAIGRLLIASNCLYVDISALYVSWTGIDDELFKRILMIEPRVSDVISRLELEMKFQRSAAKVSYEVHDAYFALHKELTYLFGIRNIIAHSPCFANGETITFHNSLTMRQDKLRDLSCTEKQIKSLTQHAVNVAIIAREFNHRALTDPDKLKADCNALSAWRNKSSLPNPIAPDKNQRRKE